MYQLLSTNSDFLQILDDFKRKPFVDCKLETERVSKVFKKHVFLCHNFYGSLLTTLHQDGKRSVPQVIFHSFDHNKGAKHWRVILIDM